MRCLKTSVLVTLVLVMCPVLLWPQARMGGHSASGGRSHGVGIGSGTKQQSDATRGVSVRVGRRSSVKQVGLGFPWFHYSSQSHYGGFGYGYGLSAFYPAEPRCESERVASYWLLALKDGIIRAVTDYRAADDRAADDRLVFVLRDGMESFVLIEELDLEFTQQLNRERGTDFNLLGPEVPAGEKRQPEPARDPASSAPTSLKGVRTICVEQMGGRLDEYIIAEIDRQLSGRLLVVLNGQGANAALVGDYTARPVWPATVSVVDKQGHSVLWSSPVKPPGIWSGSKHSRKVARRVVRNLNQAITNADKAN